MAVVTASALTALPAGDFEKPDFSAVPFVNTFLHLFADSELFDRCYVTCAEPLNFNVLRQTIEAADRKALPAAIPQVGAPSGREKVGGRKRKKGGAASHLEQRLLVAALHFFIIGLISHCFLLCATKITGKIEEHQQRIQDALLASFVETEKCFGYGAVFRKRFLNSPVQNAWCAIAERRLKKLEDLTDNIIALDEKTLKTIKEKCVELMAAAAAGTVTVTTLYNVMHTHITRYHDGVSNIVRFMLGPSVNQVDSTLSVLLLALFQKIAGGMVVSPKPFNVQSIAVGDANASKLLQRSNSSGSRKGQNIGGELDDDQSNAGTEDPPGRKGGARKRKPRVVPKKKPTTNNRKSPAR